MDKTLKSICSRLNTDGYTVENAHEIPLDCSPECRKLRHHRKCNPWGPSADHFIPVSRLQPGDKRLVDPRALRLTHVVCNVKRQAGEKKSGPITLKEWL